MDKVYTRVTQFPSTAMTELQTYWNSIEDNVDLEWTKYMNDITYTSASLIDDRFNIFYDRLRSIGLHPNVDRSGYVRHNTVNDGYQMHTDYIDIVELRHAPEPYPMYILVIPITGLLEIGFNELLPEDTGRETVNVYDRHMMYEFYNREDRPEDTPVFDSVRIEGSPVIINGSEPHTQRLHDAPLVYFYLSFSNFTGSIDDLAEIVSTEFEKF